MVVNRDVFEKIESDLRCFRGKEEQCLVERFWEAFDHFLMAYSYETSQEIYKRSYDQLHYKEMLGPDCGLFEMGDDRVFKTPLSVAVIGLPRIRNQKDGPWSCIGKFETKAHMVYCRYSTGGLGARDLCSMSETFNTLRYNRCSRVNLLQIDEDGNYLEIPTYRMGDFSDISERMYNNRILGHKK